MANNQEFAKALDEQIAKAEKLLKEMLWAVEETRASLIQLKVQKTNLFIASGIGSLR